MKINAFLGAKLTKFLDFKQVRVSFEPGIGHGGWTGHSKIFPMLGSGSLESFGQLPAFFQNALGHVFPLGQFQGLEGGSHGNGIVPTASGQKNFHGCFAERLLAYASGDGVAIAKSLGINRQVGRKAKVAMRTSSMQPSAAPHVVQNQHNPIASAKLLDSNPKTGSRQFGRSKGGM